MNVFETSYYHEIDLQFMHRQIFNIIAENIIDEMYVLIDFQLIYVHWISNTLHQDFSYCVFFCRFCRSKIARSLSFVVVWIIELLIWNNVWLIIDITFFKFKYNAMLWFVFSNKFWNNVFIIHAHKNDDSIEKKSKNFRVNFRTTSLKFVLNQKTWMKAIKMIKTSNWSSTKFRSNYSEVNIFVLQCNLIY
jgi:hypothetical protein